MYSKSLFIELVSETEKNTIVGVVYRPNSEPKADMDIFSSTLFDIMDTVRAEHKHCVVIGDMNVDLLNSQFTQKQMIILTIYFKMALYQQLQNPRESQAHQQPSLTIFIPTT